MDENFVDQTLNDGKRIFSLLERYVKLEAIDKLSVIFTVLVVLGVSFALGVTAIYCICMGLVQELAIVVGSEALSFFIVGGALVLIILLFIALRKYIVTIPAIKVMAEKLFAPTNAEENADVVNGKGGEL